MGRGRGLSCKSHLIPVQQKNTHRFFHNLQISSKSHAKTETKTQVETETRKHAQDPLSDLGMIRKSGNDSQISKYFRVPYIKIDEGEG